MRRLELAISARDMARQIITERAGLTPDQMNKLMQQGDSEERFLTAEQAKEYNLIDEIVDRFDLFASPATDSGLKI